MDIKVGIRRLFDEVLNAGTLDFYRLENGQRDNIDELGLLRQLGVVS